MPWSASAATARWESRYEFYKKGIPLVGVPKTIDNDIVGTTSCFGFDTAVSFATDAIDRLHTTAEAHRRVMVVEVMGRYAGWIALHAGVAGGADVILIPEIPYDLEKVAEGIRERDQLGARFSIVVVAEGAVPKAAGADDSCEAAHGGHAERLGGAGAGVRRCAGGDDRERNAARGARPPAARRRADGLRPGAGDALRRQGRGAASCRGQFGQMVANNPPDIVPIPLGEVVGKTQDRAARLRPAADRSRSGRVVRGLKSSVFGLQSPVRHEPD